MPGSRRPEQRDAMWEWVQRLCLHGGCQEKKYHCVCPTAALQLLARRETSSQLHTGPGKCFLLAGRAGGMRQLQAGNCPLHPNPAHLARELQQQGQEGSAHRGAPAFLCRAIRDLLASYTRSWPCLSSALLPSSLERGAGKAPGELCQQLCPSWGG